MEGWSDGVREYSWEGSPPDPIFSRYTRYAATTRVNIDDFLRSEPLHAAATGATSTIYDLLEGGIFCRR